MCNLSSTGLSTHTHALVSIFLRCVRFIFWADFISSRGGLVEASEKKSRFPDTVVHEKSEGSLNLTPVSILEEPRRPFISAF